ncbi:MAG: serine/threonine-protein kinase [Hyphomicrobiaceae bacterium]|nr:serine/threonine-protein kinase [Hyphomicrobiaceae bacterium]
MDVRSALPNGSVVEGYRIESLLGRGGFSFTYLATNAARGRFALKEYFPYELAVRSGAGHAVDAATTRDRDRFNQYRERVIVEAATLVRFSHPNIVRLHSYFTANNTVYLVMSYEPGRSLRAWLGDLGRPPSQGELDGLLAPLLAALHVVHRNRLVHRDVAPDNIHLRSLSDPVLLDFGSARSPHAVGGGRVTQFVKPGYSPPEFYDADSSRQGPWSDIYSTAATLYEAVTGNAPPDGRERSVRDPYVSVRAAPRTAYRAGFLQAIDQALAVDPQSRPRSIPAWQQIMASERPMDPPGRSPGGRVPSPARPPGQPPGWIERLVNLLR